MLENYDRILVLLEKSGRIETRKKIQKTVYLLQQKFGIFDERFSLHFYGPYSSELQFELDQLDDSKLIAQQFDEESGFYIFTLTEAANELLKTHRPHFSRSAKDIPAALVSKLNALSPRILELMATIVFFEKKYGPIKETVKKEISSIKSHLMVQFDDAWKNLDELELHSS